MELLFTFPKKPFVGSVLTIGTFDGVHLGHQQVLKKLVKASRERGLPSVAITFTNRPKDVLLPGEAPNRLTTIEEKARQLELLGIDLLVALTFTPELRDKSAESFLETLKQVFQFRHFVLGHDSRFGKGRRGDRDFVAQKMDAFQYTYECLDAFQIYGKTVSSTEIRRAIRAGNLSLAADLLGRSYSISGPVVHGDGKGRVLGFPTANIELQERCLPPFGVYAVLGRCEGKEYHGVANLGCSPTLKERGEPTLEAHLFDFDGSLYEKTLEIEFHRYLRKEKKFDSVKALQAQIELDSEQARSQFSQ
jgi:riboflavin kinase/FMN adenylyltransferase